MLYYCNAMIANPNSGVNEICANLLKYAIAAEAYMKVENPWMDDSGFLVNVMTDEQKANMEKYAYADDAVVVGRTSYAVNGDRVLFRSQALEMVSRITLRYKMSIADPTLDTSKVTFKVTYTDINGNPAVQNYSFSDLSYEEKTGYYVLDFSGFYATQMRQLAKCTIYIDGVEHGHFANSVESYCAAALGSSQTRDDVAYLVKRISLYGDACYAKYGN